MVRYQPPSPTGDLIDWLHASLECMDSTKRERKTVSMCFVALQARYFWSIPSVIDAALLSIVGGEAKAFKALKNAMTRQSSQKDIAMHHQRKERCVLSARGLGMNAITFGGVTSSPWEASVAAKLDKETKKYTIDYVTYGERTYIREGGKPGSKPVTKSKHASLSWFFEPSITLEDSDDLKDLTCEESIIRWGRDIRDRTQRSNIRNVKKSEELQESIDRGVVTIAQEIWKSTKSQEKDHRTLPIKATIDFVPLHEDRVDYIVFSHDSEGPINLPLKPENVDGMRREATNIKERGSRVQNPAIVQKAKDWGIIDDGHTSLSGDAKGRLLIAIASGWHSTLGPKSETAELSDTDSWELVNDDSS